MQPTWAVLAVAFLGVAGTLGAAVFTQMWGARREDRRWRQEQAADEQRWQRERQERREQWLRDDQLRTGQQRQEAYAQFFLAVAKWASAANTVLDRAEGMSAAGPDEVSRLDTLVEHAEASCVPLRLHGSVEVSAAAEEVCHVMLGFARALAEGPVDGVRVEQALLQFRRTTEQALSNARVDLGVR
jgi:hypothetical protein